jgi:uncharacterized coiled-coil protein SlyX
MDLLETERSRIDVIHNDYPQGVLSEYLERGAVLPGDNTAAALEAVSEAAAAIRLLEEESAQAISRAHDLACSLQTKLQLSEVRAESAEATVAELSEAVAQARDELQRLRDQLSDREAQFAVMEERAQRAEKRAGAAEVEASDANASIARILDSIRTQLPERQQIAPFR